MNRLRRYFTEILSFIKSIKGLSILLILALVLAMSPLFTQTEEQVKHPKQAELYRHYNAYSEANKRGDYDTALREAKKALEIAKEIFGREGKITAIFYKNLGFAYRGKGYHDRAIEYYKKALDI